ncbi:MAG: ATP-grasp domain-containing protein [Verrucomicrobiaceae bacterium]|nr:MAG: ATP-grasp domain-containing protein [Verrucomicrobiaceae bacterium]
MTEPRVWFNKTFSSVYNAIRLLRAADAPVKAHVHTTHINPDFVGFEVSHSRALEPVGLSEEDYVGWCLETCERERIDVFIPGRAVIPIAENRAAFESKGIRLLIAASPEMMTLFEDKARFYRELDPAVAVPARFITVNTADQFSQACEQFRNERVTACFKPSRSVGALGFRILDDSRGDLQNLMGGEPIRITTSLATSILASQPEFRDLLVMEYLDGPEYSIDCVASQGRLLRAVARRKPVRLGGSQLLEDRPELLAMAERLTRAYGLDSLFNIQVRYLGDIPKILEINARMSGGIYFACLSGLNLPAWAVALACNAVKEDELPQPRLGIQVSQQYQEFLVQHAVLEEPDAA